MLKHSLSRIVASVFLCAGVMAYVSERVSADDSAHDSNATVETESDAADQETTEDPSEPEDDVQLQGRVVVICPDGHRREYQLERSSRGPYIGGPGPVTRVPQGQYFRFGFGSSLKGLEPEVPADPETENTLDDNGERFLLGLHCTPADETLQRQLGLEAQGLVVRRVVPQMPAAFAGLQEHDILLSIGDDPLNTIDELMEAVQAAGASPIELTFLRAGAEKTVEMTPVLRDSLFAANGRHTLGEAGGWLRSRPGADVQIPSAPYRLDAIGPGTPFRDRQATDEATGRIDVLEQRIDELAEQVDDLGQTQEDGQ